MLPSTGVLLLSTFDCDPLVPYGWSDRVRELFNRARESETTADGLACQPGRVTRVTRAGCFAVLADGAEHALSADPLPAVGDWVTTTADTVRQVLPRWSEVTRVDPSGESLQVLAANADRVAVVAPADRHSPARIERELALAWDSGAIPVVLVTKADLDGDQAARTLTRRIPGVDVLPVCALDGTGLDELRALLSPNQTCLFIGPSGAGKSTLANTLLGADVLATGTSRTGDGRGRHTTTSRQLVVIPGGGVIIDTPGIRSLTLPSDIDLSRGFADIAELAGHCRFADCSHRHEPGCAVMAAVSAGELDCARLLSFQKLAGEAAVQQNRQDRR